MSRIDVSSLATQLFSLGSAFTSYAVRCALAIPSPLSRAEVIQGFVRAGASNEVPDELHSDAALAQLIRQMPDVE